MGNIKRDISWAHNAAEELAARLENLDAEDPEELQDLVELAWGIATATDVKPEGGRKSE